MAEVEGLEECLTAVNNLIPTPSKLQSAVGNGGLLVYTQARLLAPIGRGTGSGALLRSIEMSTEATMAGARCTVYTNSPYAAYVEFGTGPNGQQNHQGISPNVNVAYRATGWTIPAGSIDDAAAEAYGLSPVMKGGQVIGYRTNGQAAQPFMYPALKDHTQEVAQLIADKLKEK